MARGGIWPAVSEHGGHSRIMSYPTGAGTTTNTAGTSWREGEVLEVDEAAGDINVAVDGTLDPETAAARLVLAAASSESMIRKARGYVGTTGDADGDPVPCYLFEPGVEFITRNVFSASDTNIGPAGSNAMTGVLVGVDCDLWRDNTNPGPVSGNVNGDFGINIAGDYFTITRIVDSMGRSVSTSGAAADLIYFMRQNS